MNVEKQSKNKESTREIESRHFDPTPSGVINSEIFKTNEKALKIAKRLLSIRGEGKLLLDIDPNTNLNRALVKNGRGEIIFSTNLPSEIEELADIFYNQPH